MNQEKTADISSEELTKLIEQNSESVRNICKKYFLAGGNQDDLFQEGMIGFISAVKSFNKDFGEINSDQFKKFALMCAKRQIIDAIKQANRKKHKPLNEYISFDKTNPQLAQLENETVQYGVNPEETVIEEEEKREQLDEVNLQLTIFEKKVLSLYLEGSSYFQIAVSLGKDTKSIDNSIQRIKRKLKAGK